MKPSNLDIINQSFEIQAPNFESKTLNFSKKEYLDYTLSSVSPDKGDTILEVAAGTCACGRSFSPLVKTVVCLDATASMLQVGKEAAVNEQLHNMVFVKGYAEELPFLDDSFDIVISRLAFHHFTDRDSTSSEMVRVLKPGGKLVMIDMEAAEDPLRSAEDEIETLRDPSHVKNLSKAEMKQLYSNHGLDIEKVETSQMLQHLTDWMSLTNTPETVRQIITSRMLNEMNGKEKTGFSPYEDESGICFHQRWVLILGRKPGLAVKE